MPKEVEKEKKDEEEKEKTEEINVTPGGTPG